MRVALRKTKLVPSEFKPPPPADDPPTSSSRDEKTPAASLGPNRTPYLDTPPPTPPSTTRSISLDSAATARRTNDLPPDLDDGDLSSFITVQPAQFRDLAFFIIFNAAEARRLRPSIETILTQSSSASPTDHAYIRYTLHATAVFEATPPLPAGWKSPTAVIAPPPPPPQQSSRGPRVLGAISSASGGRPSILGNLLTNDRERARESQSSPSPITPATPLPMTEEAVEQLVITRYDIPQVRQVLMPQSELRWSSRQQSQNPVSSGSLRDHGVNYLVSIDKTVLSPLGKVTLRLRINQSPRKEIWVEKLRFLLDEVETVQVDRTRTVLQWEVRAAEPGETIRPQEILI
ncbi:hypothetical protein BJ742DRAFT_400125 [Cladochytrium replicatum]|nr:hypothetical protein BJ742DRAFT_400125 [Cladochytrium replicatum]